LHDVHTGPLLKFVQVPLEGKPFLRYVEEKIGRMRKIKGTLKRVS